MKKEQILRLKIKFESITSPFTKPSEDYIVGCVQTLFGEENKYHDSFSNYNVSGLLGGKVQDDGSMTYPDGCYFLFSSTDEELISKVVNNLFLKKTDLYLREASFEGFEMVFDDINRDYDIVNTISPILLKKDKRYLTFNDEDFLEYLTLQCKKKLQYEGISDKEISKFSIEPFHFENGAVKYTKRKNYALPASNIMLLVKGSPKCRKIIYENGFGNSTGYCYGTIKIKES